MNLSFVYSADQSMDQTAKILGDQSVDKLVDHLMELLVEQIMNW